MLACPWYLGSLRGNHAAIPHAWLPREAGNSSIPGRCAAPSGMQVCASHGCAAKVGGSAFARRCGSQRLAMRVVLRVGLLDSEVHAAGGHTQLQRHIARSRNPP